MSTNAKGKLIWLGTFELLQQFVEDILNLSNSIWDCPGGHDKRFKSEKIDTEMVFGRKIRITGISVPKRFANAEDHNKIADDHNEKEMHTNDERGLTDTDRNLFLEALKSQLQALCKKVKENESALKILN